MKEWKSMTQLARELRRRQTPEEELLWKNLRNRKLNGWKFLRQHPIVYGCDEKGRKRFFIADFYCAERKLVVELDRKIHDLQKDYDQNRDAILNELGLRVLRFRNEELKDVGKVRRRIQLSPGPSL